MTPFSINVNLPRDHEARFPNRCVLCGDDPLGNRVKIWTHTLGWWTWILWMFGRPFSVSVPACAGCAWRIRLQRWGRFVVFIVLTVVVVFLVLPYIQPHVPRPFQK